MRSATFEIYLPYSRTPFTVPVECYIINMNMGKLDISNRKPALNKQSFK